MPATQSPSDDPAADLAAVRRQLAPDDPAADLAAVRGQRPPAMNFAIVNGVKVPLEGIPEDVQQELLNHTQQGDTLLENLKSMGHLAVGAVKGAASTAVGAGRLVQMIPGVTKAVDYLYGTPGISQEAMRQAQAATAPTSTAETVGKVGEQIGEIALTGGPLTRASGAAATRLAPTLTPIVGRTIAKYGPKAAVEAAGQAGIAAVQGGDPRLAAIGGAITPAVGAVVEALPAKLKEQAAKQVVQALGPTKERFKAIAEKLVPQILQRGLGGSREALQEQAATTLSKVGTELDAILAQHATQPVGIQPVVQALETAKDAFRTTSAAGAVVEFEPRAIKQLSGLQQVLTDLGPTPTVEQLVAVRRAWDKVVSQAGGFEHRAAGAIGVPLKDISEAWAKREATSAIRGQLAADVPDLAAINKEWAFWKSLNDVLRQTLKRIQPQGIGLGRVITTGAGAAAGAMAGSSLGPVGALSGAAALAKVSDMARSVMQSPQWRFASAQIKDRLADAIVSNDVNKIAMALARVTSVEGSKASTP